MSARFLESLRAAELDAVTSYIPAGARILEIGAGAGWQARRLAERGHHVEAIDLAGGEYEQLQVWPVRPYDGVTIPYPDAAFDVVFSSNVLEHVPHVRAFQRELQRVLAPGGIAIHVLPTGSWRLWTTLTYYLHQARRVARRLLRGAEGTPGAAVGDGPARRRGWLAALLPTRHGEEGNVLTELYLFSGVRWRRLFRSTGWRVRADVPAGLFYTGYGVLDGRLGLPARARLGRVLGSACRIYVLARLP